MNENPTKTYYNDLDIARGVLMALGVVLHTANVFAPGATPPIQSAEQSKFFLILSDAIHLFRMPAFFAVSGFFCWMSLKRYGAAKFLKLRSQRILIPLFATGVTFNAIELWLTARFAGGAQGFIEFAMSGALFKAYASGEWVLHLWFLIVVFVYFAISAGLMQVIQKFSPPKSSTLEKFLKWGLEKSVVIIIIGSAAAYLPHILGAIIPAVVHTGYLFGISLHTVLEYFPFFAFGALLNYFPSPLEKLRRFSPAKAVVFSITAIFVPIIFHAGVISENVAVGFWNAGAWITTLTIFGLFSALIDRIKTPSNLIAEPTYSIYLAHHLFVLIVGAAILNAPTPIAVQFGLIVVIVLLTTLLLHFLVIKKSRVLRFLYNGK